MTEAANTERELLKILRALASELDFVVEPDPTGWVVRLVRPDGRSLLVYGYDFGLNPSSSADIARDKSACSQVLQAQGVPCVEHRIVFRPDWARFTGQPSTFAAALDAFNAFGGNAVCKHNRGTGGAEVFHVQTVGELERALAQVFAVHHACAIAPYVPIEAEIRVILVDGVATAVFSKHRHTVIGDGQSDLATLVASQCPQAVGTPWLVELGAQRLQAVLPAGQQEVLHWKHNLGQGAQPVFDVPAPRRDATVALAQRACAALLLRAASVDIVWSDNTPCVLEVNSGIMVENLARSGPVGQQLAQNTYRALVRGGFGLA